ncbi:response regulator [bacterium]|nr:response regulator [bacterium]
MNDSKKVLIIDDEHDIREGVSYWLRSAGYAPILASDGDAGIQAARRSIPQAIVLDVQMPHQDGIETLVQLRCDSETRRIPIIMLSASLQDESRAFDAGARFFVQKPYEGRRLISAVNAALGSADC